MYLARKNISIENILFFFTFLLVIVFPNTFRDIKLWLILFLILISFKSIKRFNRTIIIYYLLGLIVTTTYLIIGSLKSTAPIEAANQVVIIYMLTPLMWMVISTYIVNQFNLLNLWKLSIIYTIGGCFLVFLAIWLFDNGFIYLLEFIIDTPNKILTTDGIIAVKLHVYGSLIFLFPAILQTFKIFKNRFFFYTLILLFLITAFVSGRDGLMLSLFIGVLLFFIFNKRKNFLIQILLIISALYLSNIILGSFDINIFKIFEGFIKKINSGGESARTEQFKALVEGINQNIFGAGHGVGVSYIRNYNYPWRYEILPLALIYRVSLFGFIIYALPFLYSIKQFMKLHINSQDDLIDRFMVSGLISIVVASFTNPYLESFEFQFFYVFPFIYFITRKQKLRLFRNS